MTQYQDLPQKEKEQLEIQFGISQKMIELGMEVAPSVLRLEPASYETITKRRDFERAYQLINKLNDENFLRLIRILGYHRTTQPIEVNKAYILGCAERLERDKKEELRTTEKNERAKRERTASWHILRMATHIQTESVRKDLDEHAQKCTLTELQAIYDKAVNNKINIVDEEIKNTFCSWLMNWIEKKRSSESHEPIKKKSMPTAM